MLSISRENLIDYVRSSFDLWCLSALESKYYQMMRYAVNWYRIDTISLVVFFSAFKLVVLKSIVSEIDMYGSIPAPDFNLFTPENTLQIIESFPVYNTILTPYIQRRQNKPGIKDLVPSYMLLAALEDIQAYDFKGKSLEDIPKKYGGFLSPFFQRIKVCYQIPRLNPMFKDEVKTAADAVAKFDAFSLQYNDYIKSLEEENRALVDNNLLVCDSKLNAPNSSAGKANKITVSSLCKDNRFTKTLDDLIKRKYIRNSGRKNVYIVTRNAKTFCRALYEIGRKNGIIFSSDYDNALDLMFCRENKTTGKNMRYEVSTFKKYMGQARKDLE